MSNVPTEITAGDIARTLLAQNAGELVLLVLSQHALIVPAMLQACADLKDLGEKFEFLTRPSRSTIVLANGTEARAYYKGHSDFDESTGMIRTLSNSPTYWIAA